MHMEPFNTPIFRGFDEPIPCKESFGKKAHISVPSHYSMRKLVKGCKPPFFGLVVLAISNDQPTRCLLHHLIILPQKLQELLAHVVFWGLFKKWVGHIFAFF